MLIKSDARLELRFQTIFVRFLKPKWTLKRAPKSLEDEVFRDLGAPAPPRGLQEASRKPFWSLFGLCWSHFGAKIAPQTSTSIQNHFLASLPFPPAAIFEPSLFSSLRSVNSLKISFFPNPLGSVAGLGALAPLEIRPLSL